MKENKFRYAVNIEYLGGMFSGSQVQPEQKTIQSEVERAMAILLKKETKAVFAGRTDSGVHAKSQFFHFDCGNELESKKFTYSLNALLPDEISVKQMKQVDKTFHAQKSARYRWYRYMIDNKICRSALLREISAHVPESLDIKEMQKALNYLKGVHDFSGFKNANTANPAQECNLIYGNCRKISEIIYIDLIANRFLYNMVRIIAGTLIKIGEGKYSAEKMLEILERKDRKLAGPTAEPQGLMLMCTGYDEKYNLNELMNMESTNEQNILCKAS